MTDVDKLEIIVEGLFIFKRQIDSLETMTEKRPFIKKFQGLYNYARSYNYELPLELKRYYEIITGQI